MPCITRCLLKVAWRSSAAVELNEDTSIIDHVLLGAKVTLRYAKGQKRNTSQNLTIRLDSCHNSGDNVVDPVKLVFVHALRQGAIKDAITAEDAVREALGAGNGLVE